MKSSIEQSIKEKLKMLAKEREISFAQLWRNLILERFLTRLSQSSYRGKFVLKGGSLLAKFGATRTIIRIDLGFGDMVEAIDYPMDLIATKKGPLFESKISLRCYPKEFIFAEKLETVVFRGEGNTRMKDFHDLYSLISLGNLSKVLTEKAIQLVFNHRRTSLKGLPIAFDTQALNLLEIRVELVPSKT
jgi:predicted nucleotidyltransferase component of viral defense system